MDWAIVLVVALVVAAVAGVLLLPRRKQWNADGEADERREVLSRRLDSGARAPDDAARALLDDDEEPEAGP